MMEIERRNRELKKRVVIFTFIFLVIFLLSAFAYGYEITLFGLNSIPVRSDQEESRLIVDLGMHSTPSEEWKSALQRAGEVLVLPSSDDLYNQLSNLKNLEKEGFSIIVSDLFDEKQKTVFPSYGLHTENYHPVLLFNWVMDQPDNKTIESALKTIEKEKPDKIVMVATKNNRDHLKEKFAAFQGQIEWIVREYLTSSFPLTVVVPEKPVLLFFYSSRCPICRHLKNDVTPQIFEKYREQVKVVYLDYVISTNYEKLAFLEERWMVENKTSVEIFSEAGYIASEDEKTINSQIEELIQKTLTLSEKGKKTVTTDFAGKIEEIILKRFKGFTPWVVAGAGVLDGLNPCAFATIIFMVNLLMVLGHSRKRILEIGFTYSLSVFVTYLLLGLGLFQIWQTISAYQIISRIIYGVMASILIIFAFFSIKDAIQYRKDKKETEFSLGLPKGFRVKINQYLKRSFSEKKLIVAAILSGFVISLLEAGCTGQIYLPTIMYIARESTSLRVFFYLFLYNVFFIIPLLVVFLGVYYGSQSKALVGFGRKNILFSKLALGALFIILSFLLWQSALS
jgi:cytochrome c biogenesis protein CcdA